jgi:hypothetical protein
MMAMSGGTMMEREHSDPHFDAMNARLLRREATAPRSQ